MAKGFNVNSLPEYVEQNKGELIAKTVFGPVTVDNVTIQTGLKGKTAINLIDTDVTFSDGKTCGFNADGETRLSQRYINPKHVKVQNEWCDKDLLGKYAEYEVVSAATGKKLPFEAEIMDQIIKKVQAGIETTIWDGFNGAADTGGEGEGLYSILINEVDTSLKTAGYDGTNAWQLVNNAYLKLPTNVLGADDLVLYASVDLFEHLVLELVTKNLYHYNPNDKAGEITMPGTGVKIVRCPGMGAGQHKDLVAVFARKSNVFYGIDLDNDATDIDFWYSKDTRTFRSSIEFVIGMQIAFPEEVSVITK